MTNRLYIAEKREVASAMAEAFEGKSAKPVLGAYHTREGVVTWLSGHLLELTKPEDHNPDYKKWQISHLPLQYPVKHVPIQRSKNNLAFVLKAIDQAEVLVNAGDPDPEGQRLVDEVIEYANATRKACFRILINDNNPDAILKANTKLEPNKKYWGLSMSALARAVCDQRYGFNLSRLYTLVAKKQGSDATLSVGRVQTPILGLIVNRDHAHEQHQQTPYFVVSANIQIANTSVTAQFVPPKDAPLDDNQRITDQAYAQAVTTACQGATATIQQIATKDKARAAPLPYNLLALQAEAASRFGYKPKDVLAITQNLRDKHKAITYNRSDCRYLNDERHAEAPALLAALKSQYGLMAGNAEPARKSKAFNSGKVTAHHAIIPTLNVPVLNALPAPERNVYDLIARLYIAQFYPPETYRSTSVQFFVVNPESEQPHHAFKATARVDVARGWLDLYEGAAPEEKADNAPEEEIRLNLENLVQGDEGAIKQAVSREAFTQPLPYYTMAALLKDLARVAKYVKDPHIKKLLLDKDADKQDEAGGIGTPATRDTHIDTLFERGYVIEKGKALVSTALGRQLIASLPAFATSPDMTALWHEKQKLIESGELDWQDLVAEVDRAIEDEVRRLQAGDVALGMTKTAGVPCPVCETGTLRLRKGKMGKFWGCDRHPECTATFPDNKGKPQLTGKPQPSAEHFCPECKAPLIRRPSTKQPNTFWWGCSDWRSGCKFIASDDNGIPKTRNRGASHAN